MNRKPRQCTIWGFAAFIILSGCNVSPPAITRQDFAEKYNATLKTAFETHQGGRTKEAYEITAELEILCEQDRHFFEASNVCSSDHLAEIRGGFLYELSYQEASALARAGDYHGTVKILEALEPNCVDRRPEKCISDHDWLLNNMQLMAIRKEVHRLVGINKFREASIEFMKAEPYAAAISEEQQNDYHWELAQVLAFYSPGEAVAEVRELVRARKFNSIRPVSNYSSYLLWLVNAGEAREVASELVRFFETCREYGGLGVALAPEDTKEETLEWLDLLLRSLMQMDSNVEDLTQALLDAGNLAEGEVRSLILRGTGDFVLAKSGKERLATQLYRESGLGNTETAQQLDFARKGFDGVADNVAASEPGPSLESRLHAAMEAVLSGDKRVDTLMKLGEIWDSQSPAEIENHLGEYVMATMLLAEARLNLDERKLILSRGYLEIEDRLTALQQKYRLDKLVVDRYVKVDLNEYVLLLELAKVRARTLEWDKEYLEYSKEQLRVREALFGDQSYQLLFSLSSLADGYRALGEEASFSEIFLRAKSLEANNLSASGQCNLPPYRFEYSFDYARRVLSQPLIEKWFLSEGSIHLENAKNFIGIEKHYQCLAAVNQLVSEYLYLTNDRGSNLNLIYELSQIVDISDLLISTELGLEKLRIEDPDLSDKLVTYGQISQDINAPGASSNSDGSLENFLKYRKQKSEIYERMRSEAPEVASLMIAQGLSVSKTQKSLAGDEALLYYMEIPTIKGGEKTGMIESDQSSHLLFVVKSNGVYLFPLQPKTPLDITSNLQRVRGTLDQGVNRASELSPFDLEAAKAIFDMLLSPALGVLDTTRRLFIIPSPSLAGIPFELLPTTDELPTVKSFIDFRKYRDVSWMNDRYAISYLSSPRMLGRRRNTANAIDSEFLGVGNPEFSLPAESLPASTKPGVPSSSNTLQSMLLDDYKALSAAGSVASSLPEAQLIVNSMARQYGEHATILTGVLATESRLSGLDWSQYSTIAFATHGLLGTDLVQGPALVLGREAGGSAFDGLLTTREIVRMKLGAKLVVLAACNSATKDRIDGVASLANSFLTAGGASVVASHWAVDVKATAKLFDAFAQRREMAPETPSADLLQHARMDILRQNKNQLFAHPTFWGGFATYGF
jgi:CHAT domain-containing protein